MNILRHTVLSGATLLLGALTVSAQTGTVRGRVVNGEGSAVDFAAVVVKPAGLYTMTDSRGTFDIGKVPVGKVSLEVTFYGMEPVDTTFTLKGGQTVDLRLTMRETTFFLVNVTVVAKRSEAGRSTASEISRQAMDHMQTSSLGDIMALLPGVQISNPNLSKAQTLSVRNNSGSAMGSLGTGVFVDGAPLSNNANLQFLSTAQSGSSLNVASSGNANSGLDIRGLSTDNIESVEVIRGIPSVEYGDITSGAVLVRSKAGKSPLTVRFKTNPNIYQVSAAKGFRLSDRAGDLNVSGDYAYNRAYLTKDFKDYQRANVKGLWTVRLGKDGRASENTSLTLTYARDRSRLTPDSSGREQYWENDYGVQFNTNGRWYGGGDWLKAVNWLVSGSYSDRSSHYEDLLSNATSLYSTAMSDGQIYSHAIGVPVYDAVSGLRITNDESVKGTILPYSYQTEYDIYGKEVNAFAKVNAEFSHTWNRFTDRLLAGADFKTDGNLGKGAVYDDETPPFRSVSNKSSGYRRRNYYDIPFVNQFGLYVENQGMWSLGERRFFVTAGARFDAVNGKTILAPRINASADIFPWLSVRGGWGVTAKAPTSLYLYPMDAYLDDILYNGMFANYPPEEQVLVAKTSVFKAENPDLEIARNRKAEVGFDLKAGRCRLSVTAYDERMDNGYVMGLGPASFKRIEHVAYRESSRNEGALPDIAYASTTYPFFTVYMPYNSGRTVNRGLEYEMDFGRIDAIRTSFYMNGAWTYGASGNQYAYAATSKSNAAQWNIGVYGPDRRTYCYENLVTTFRATHNIPKIGFVVTGTAQVSWFEKDWSKFRNEDRFAGYISWEDGLYHEQEIVFSDNTDPAFADIIPEIYPSWYVVEKTTPYVILNLNISKEIGDVLTASFYVNNLFNSHPLYRTKQNGTMQNMAAHIPIFFGFEMKVNIK